MWKKKEQKKKWEAQCKIFLIWLSYCCFLSYCLNYCCSGDHSNSLWLICFSLSLLVWERRKKFNFDRLTVVYKLIISWIFLWGMAIELIKKGAFSIVSFAFNVYAWCMQAHQEYFYADFLILYRHMHAAMVIKYSILWRYI